MVYRQDAALVSDRNKINNLIQHISKIEKLEIHA